MSDPAPSTANAGEPAESLPGAPGGASAPVDLPEAPGGALGGDPEATSEAGGDADPPAGSEQRRESKEQRYRRERNDAQTRVGELEAQLRDRDEEDAVRLAGQHLANGADFVVWGGLADARDPDTGRVDPDKVKAVCEAMVRERPYMRRPAPSFVQGNRGGSPPTGVSWGDVFKSR